MMKVIKKDTFALCVPITPRNAGELMAQVQAASAAEPDFIEWRRDYFEPIALNEEQELLSKIKEIRGGVGLIYTYRSPLEGGIAQVEEACRLTYILGCIACDGADYIGVGAVFSTNTKKNTKNVTIKMLQEIVKAVSIPVVAIGGINCSNVKYLHETGISGIAVVSAILGAVQAYSAAKKMKKLVISTLINNKYSSN